jgi:hypothetical protein
MSFLALNLYASSHNARVASDESVDDFRSFFPYHLSGSRRLCHLRIFLRIEHC